MERFWDKVRKSDGCWEWQGKLEKTGYGRFKLNGKAEMAHRASYILAHGGIPEGKVICHKCNNRRCVNPDHLYAGTQKDNVADAIRAGTHYWGILEYPGKTRVLRGNDNPITKITDETAIEIFRRAKLGESLRVIAADLGVALHTVKDISAGRSRGWLTSSLRGAAMGSIGA